MYDTLGAMGGLATGGLLGQVAEGLSVPRRALWSLAGQGLDALGGGGSLSAALRSGSGAQLMGALGMDPEGLGAKAVGFGAEVLGDPLTYLGGVLGKGLAGPWQKEASLTRNLGKIDDVERSLLQSQQADQAFLQATAPNLPAGGAFGSKGAIPLSPGGELTAYTPGTGSTRNVLSEMGRLGQGPPAPLSPAGLGVSYQTVVNPATTPYEFAQSPMARQILGTGADLEGVASGAMFNKSPKAVQAKNSVAQRAARGPWTVSPDNAQVMIDAGLGEMTPSGFAMYGSGRYPGGTGTGMMPGVSIGATKGVGGQGPIPGDLPFRLGPGERDSMMAAMAANGSLTGEDLAGLLAMRRSGASLGGGGASPGMLSQALAEGGGAASLNQAIPAAGGLPQMPAGPSTAMGQMPLGQPAGGRLAVSGPAGGYAMDLPRANLQPSLDQLWRQKKLMQEQLQQYGPMSGLDIFNAGVGGFLGGAALGMPLFGYSQGQ
jgi:hypothetical protein